MSPPVQRHPPTQIVQHRVEAGALGFQAAIEGLSAEAQALGDGAHRQVAGM